MDGFSNFLISALHSKSATRPAGDQRGRRTSTRLEPPLFRLR